MKTTRAIATLTALLLGGCATPTVVDTVKVGDGALTCDQIKTEIAEASNFEKQARGERKVTGTNVAAAVLFWPALIATYSNTEDAINAARERREKMIKLANAKRCPTSVTSDDIVPIAAPARTPPAASTAKAGAHGDGATYADVTKANTERVRGCKSNGGSVVKVSRVWMEDDTLKISATADGANAESYALKAPLSAAQMKALKGKLTCAGRT